MNGLLSASTLSVLVSPSALSLLAVNLGVIFFAVRDNWSLAAILMSYLAQSVVIGIFQAIKMSDLKVFSTGGYKINNRPVPPTPTVKWIVVLIFVVHYGLFQFGYAKFILDILGAGKWNAGLCSRISLRSIRATLTPRYLLAAIDARCDGAAAGVASRKASQRASTAARRFGTNYGLSRCFIARLLDSPKSAERKNLTLRNLTDLVDESLKMPIAQLIDKAIADAKFARDWRDRVIPHRDLGLALEDGAAEPLQAASRADVKTALASLADIMNAVQNHYLDSQTIYDAGSRHNGAVTLLYLLGDGLKLRSEREGLLQRAIESGSEEDLQKAMDANIQDKI
jgi:hypothetical protein